MGPEASYRAASTGRESEAICARRRLIFVHGKGGVGKSAMSYAIARELADKGARTLITSFEDPTRPPGELKQLGPALWRLNADSMLAFEEYAGLKIEKLANIGPSFLSSLGSFGATKVTRIFTRNKVIRYLAKAAPGVHDLVLLGKVWYESRNYDHLIVDMPSTGYGLAMFQSTVNFAKLFGSGPLARDADEMLETFRDPLSTGHCVVALPEEMPLREALEIDRFLEDLFPVNRPAFLVNRRFPGRRSETSVPENASPFATSMSEYASRRKVLEQANLRLWTSAGIRFASVDYFPPSSCDDLGREIGKQLKEQGFL